MTVQTNAGTTIEVSTATPATYDAVGFAALSFTNIAEVVSIAEHGGTTALVTHNPLDTRRTAKFKGSINDGSMVVGLGMDIADAGQVILKDGALGANIDVDHSFQITYQDGGIEYFQAKIMGYTRNPGTIDQIVGANTTLELVNDVIDA
tara:strand:+ start:486 stop:932 length:447 start_codon:yes stop_codon:yes gene_type:complete